MQYRSHRRSDFPTCSVLLHLPSSAAKQQEARTDCQLLVLIIRNLRNRSIVLQILLLSALRSRMDNLSDSFTGRTHEAFIGKLDEWKLASDELLTALGGLGDFLRAAADTIEDVDVQLAGQLAG